MKQHVHLSYHPQQELDLYTLGNIQIEGPRHMCLRYQKLTFHVFHQEGHFGSDKFMNLSIQ